MRLFAGILIVIAILVSSAFGADETDGMAFYVLYKGTDATAATYNILTHSQNPNGRAAKRWAAVALTDTAYVTLKSGGVAFDTIILAPGTSISSDQYGNPVCDSVRIRRVSTSGYVAFIAFYDK